MTATETPPRRAETDQPTIIMLPVTALALGDDFRLDDDVEALAEMAASIAEHGVLQPLTVRQVADGWEVVAGRRRLAASRMAGLEIVPCLARSLTDDEAVDIALTENIHRRDLSAVEEGLAFARLRDQGLTQVQIAQRVGRSQTHVSMLLRVLDLPVEIRDKIHQRRMSYATALDRWGRKRFREDGEHRDGSHKRSGLTGSDSELVSHWRRRHDRLLGGLFAILKARPAHADESLRMIDRLVKLDAQPFPESAA